MKKWTWGILESLVKILYVFYGFTQGEKSRDAGDVVKKLLVDILTIHHVKFLEKSGDCTHGSRLLLSS